MWCTSYATIFHLADAFTWKTTGYIFRFYVTVTVKAIKMTYNKKAAAK